MWTSPPEFQQHHGVLTFCVWKPLIQRLCCSQCSGELLERQRIQGRIHSADPLSLGFGTL